MVSCELWNCPPNSKPIQNRRYESHPVESFSFWLDQSELSLNQFMKRIYCWTVSSLRERDHGQEQLQAD